MDDFLANNVNGFSGDLLICDSYVIRLFPEAVAVATKGRAAYFFSPEASHIDQLGFKLTTVLRLGRVTSLNVLTKDGSPHSLQIPLVVQEAALNSGFPATGLHFFVIDKAGVTEVSHQTVRLARHLAEIESLTTHENAQSKQDARSSPDCLAAVLVGGRSDLQQVRNSGMMGIFEALSIPSELSVISSEQNPEELRRYCQALMGKNVSVVVCIAGMVPGLPAAVKAQLPAVPVLSVPLSTPGFSVTDIMLASFSVPARRPVIMSGLDEIGLKKSAYLACEMISMSNPVLRRRYLEFIQEVTPKPDIALEISPADDGGTATMLKRIPRNGDTGGL